MVDMQGIELLTVAKKQLPATDTSSSGPPHSGGQVQTGPIVMESSALVSGPRDSNAVDCNDGQLVVTDSKLEMDGTTGRL